MLRLLTLPAARHRCLRAMTSSAAPSTASTSSTAPPSPPAKRLSGVWARLVDPASGTFHLGFTASAAAAAAPTAGGAVHFVDPVRPGSILHEGTPCFMVEGDAGMATLNSPLSGYVVETNDAATGHLGPDAAAALGADPDAGEHWVVAIEADVEEWEELRDDGGSYVPEG